MFLAGPLETSVGVRLLSNVCGDGMGEKLFSSAEEKVVEDAGDVLPQPNKDPSFDPPGDLGCDFCMVLLESFEKLRVLTFMVCGGSGFEEKSDIVVDRE